MEKLVSVIVPIHNTSKYLKRCLNSITKQIYSNLEIVLINDGSTDKSGEICNKYAKKDSRIKVLHNETAGGVANARNKGLSIATGEYINFVDGDDWLTKNAIKVLVEGLEQNNADMSQGDFQVVYAKKVNEKNKACDVWDCSNKVLKLDFLIQNTGAIWARIFKKEIIDRNNIKYYNYSFFEDAMFVVDYLKHVNKAVVVNDIVYYYNRLVKNSLTRKKRDGKLGEVMKVATQNYLDFYGETLKDVSDKYGFFNTLNCYCNDCLTRVVKLDLTEQEIKEYIAELQIDFKNILQKYDVLKNLTQDSRYTYEFVNLSAEQLYNNKMAVLNSKATKKRETIKKIFAPFLRFIIFKLGMLYND